MTGDVQIRQNYDCDSFISDWGLLIQEQNGLRILGTDKEMTEIA
jgi:hypothetical protein